MKSKPAKEGRRTRPAPKKDMIMEDLREANRWLALGDFKRFDRSLASAIRRSRRRARAPIR